MLSLAWLTAGVGVSRGAIRTIEGRQFTLLTDAPSSPTVDALPEIFDQAVGQWADYFKIERSRAADWKVVGCLMQSREAFEQAGLAPKHLPAFKSGFSDGKRLWLYDQTSEYYRRHLLLHEGTHSFMAMAYGALGPPWFAEGVAELLANHRWSDGRLTLNVYPRDVTEVPRLGRIKIVHDGYAAGHAMSLPKVMTYDSRAHLQNEPYGWCWAAAALFDGSPRYREHFRQAPPWVVESDFNERLINLLGPDWPRACEEWQVFVANIEHGYDFGRMAIDFTPGRPLGAHGGETAVAADRGWQSSGVRLEAGRAYSVSATGRYQVADQPKIWWSEPGGVSIEYYHSQPLGILLGAVRPDEQDPRQATPLVKPLVIGRGATIEPETAGTLYLRINDSAGKLADNAGSLQVKIVETGPRPAAPEPAK